LAAGFQIIPEIPIISEALVTQIIATAEPFFFAGKGANAKIGCLVTHGFTGTPKEVRWLGEYLNQQGYTVCGIRLNGHATKPGDMVRSRWQDWLLSVEDGYNLLHSCTEQVFLLGLSMGGVLSLTAASRLPVRGVVAMSTPYQLPAHGFFGLTSVLSRFIPYMSKAKGDPDKGWFDKEAFKQHVAYPKNPVRSAGELNKLTGKMRKALPLVKVPVLLIHSRNDDYVFRGSMENIHSALGSTDKKMVWVKGGGHVITEEPTREVVFKAAADFINRIAAA
jgi:carboxylesterase